MNKLLNNLLGMYKQAKLNKKAEEVVYDSDLIAQVLSMTKNQKEDEFSIVTLSPEKDKVLGVKYIKKDEVYDYKPNQNEYALVMTRDTGFADTDYQLQPMIMVVRSWNEGRKFYATKKNRLNKKAEEKESAKKDYTEQYAKVKEIMKEYGYGLSDGGYIYLISKEQPKDEGFQVKFKGDRLRVELDGKLKYSGYGPEAIEDFLKGMFYAKKLSSKNTKLTKKANEELNKEYKLLENGLPTFKFNKKIIDFLDSINKKFDKFCVKIYGKIVCFNEIKDKKLITDKGEEFDYRDFNAGLLLKIYNKLNNSKESSKAKAVRKQAKYEETVQGDEKVKDSAKSFGYDIKFAGHYGRWIYYYLIDEKGNIIRDDKEYQKVYDEMKKRIDDDIDINGYDFVKALIEEVDGELMRVPTIVISEYSLLPNHKDREENTGLEEFKRDFNLSSSTKKQAVLQESENGLGYVLPNGSVVDPIKDKGILETELRDNTKLLKEQKGKLAKLEKHMKDNPNINFGKFPGDVFEQANVLKNNIKYIEEFNKTIEEILNVSKQATKKQATIKHENGVYNVYSESGKCLGKGYKTKEEAEKRLKQVEYFKNKKSSLSTKPYFQTSKEMVKDALDLWHSRQTLYNKKYNTDEELGEAEIEQKNKEYNFLIKWNYEYGDFMNTNNDILYKLITNQISIEQAVEKINAFFEQVYNYDPLNPHKKKAYFYNKRSSLKQVVISKMAGKTRKIKFKRIDAWNRPIFVDIDSLSKQDGSLNATKGFYLTDVDNLFSEGTTEKEIKDFYKDKELNKILVYKGQYPNSEPMGNSLEEDTLILI